MKIKGEDARKKLKNDPVYVIGVILSVVLLLFAVYFIGPWYPVEGGGAIAAAAGAQTTRAVLGIFYTVAGGLTLLGISHHRLRAYGTFGMFLAYLFVGMLRLFAIGVFPVVWLFPLALALVSGVIYLYSSLHEEDEEDPLHESI
jgi:hypothetical protein